MAETAIPVTLFGNGVMACGLNQLCPHAIVSNLWNLVGWPRGVAYTVSDNFVAPCP